MIKIDQAKLSSTTASIVFNTIPQDYDQLLITLSARTTENANNDGDYTNIGYRFNDSTTGYFMRSVGTYDTTILSDDNTTASYSFGTGGRLFRGIAQSYSGKTSFESFEMRIYNYKTSGTKVWSAESGSASNVASTQELQQTASGYWVNSDPITKIELGLGGSSQFVAESVVTLYGIKANPYFGSAIVN